MKAVVFGAGEIGTKVRKIFEEEGLEVSCYFDNNEKKWGNEFDGLHVNSPKDLHEIQYDVIGIGALKAAETIKKQLIDKGVDSSIIRIPITNKKVFFNEQILPEEEYYFDNKKALQLSSRADIILRYVLLKMFLFERKFNVDLLELFKKCFINGDKVGDVLKSSVKNIIDTELSLKNREQNLVKKIKQIAEDDNCWNTVYSVAELVQVTFKDALNLLQRCEDKIEMFNAYLELNKNCTLAFLVGECKVEFGNSSTIAEIDLNFEGNYIGFLSFLRSMNNDFRKNAYVLDSETKSILEFKELKIRILLMDNNKICNFKALEKYKNMVILHEQLQDIKKNVLNNETLKFLRRRLPICEEKRFFDMLDEVKNKMKEFNIPIDKVCIVGGGTLQAYGMRTATDIDLIITEDFRKLYGDGLVLVSDNVEIHHSDEFDISDHDIITNPQNHFYYYGIKFMSLDILYRKRKLTRSTDARLIELYQSYVNK